MKKLKAYYIEDEPLTLEVVSEGISHYLNVEIIKLKSAEDVIERILKRDTTKDKIDFILSGVVLQRRTGIELFKTIRNLDDNVLYYDCLRLKHIPFIFYSGGGFQAVQEYILKNNSNAIAYRKPTPVEELVKGIIKSVTNYRKDITTDISSNGHCIRYEDGIFRVYNYYSVPVGAETKYIKGQQSEVSKSITRKILIQHDLRFSQFALSQFEILLNDPRTTEKQMHDFFLSFPEFLLGNHSQLYSEKMFSHGSQKYRFDILTPTIGFEKDPSKWNLFELKRHSVNLLTKKSVHKNFTKSVYNGISQLRNYNEYFKNINNQGKLRKQFGGIVPQPNLMLVIGQKTSDLENFNYQKRQFPDINIITYDEILEWKKISLSYMNNLII